MFFSNSFLNNSFLSLKDLQASKIKSNEINLLKNHFCYISKLERGKFYKVLQRLGTIYFYKLFSQFTLILTKVSKPRNWLKVLLGGPSAFLTKKSLWEDNIYQCHSPKTNAYISQNLQFAPQNISLQESSFSL